MGLIKFILKKFKCSSSCAYDPNNEMFNRQSLSVPLEDYELKFKDMKKIMKILNKRKTIKLKSFEI
tara:strand:- start:654 stop:851 length:198 start_codon:yes stop_codon:yes gene_type:complete